jgi:hypothetical protein
MDNSNSIAGLAEFSWQEWQKMVDDLSAHDFDMYTSAYKENSPRQLESDAFVESELADELLPDVRSHRDQMQSSRNVTESLDQSQKVKPIWESEPMILPQNCDPPLGGSFSDLTSRVIYLEQM